MFVVAPISRRLKKDADPAKNDSWDHVYPVLWEDEANGLTHAPIANSDKREEAQALSDELNSVLLKHVQQ